MTFLELIKTNPDKILYDATEFLSRSDLKHYKNFDQESLRAKLAKLYFATRECVEKNTIAPIQKFISQVAPDRFESGFDLYEVQTAINILEECYWKNIVERVNPEEKMHALVRTHEILCAAKNALAKSYIEYKKVPPAK
jgi:hypothetical protein